MPGTGTTIALIKALGAKISPEDIQNAADSWLEENITNPDSPPLDRSLSASSAAAPADIVGNLKNEIAEKTYNLVIGKLSGRTINSSGQRALNSPTDLWACPVIQDQKYTIQSPIATGASMVLGFFESSPLDGATTTTYNNSRTVLSKSDSYTITAPITGYIGFISITGSEEVQIVDGEEAKTYLPPLTAYDYISRQEINTIKPDVLDSKTKINSVITTKPVYESVTGFTITDNAYKQFGDGSDSPSTAWEYATLPVSVGEIYRISCTAGQWAKPWILLNSNNSVIAKSDLPTSTPVSSVSEIVTIQQNGAYLVVNNRKADGDIVYERKTGDEYVVDGDDVVVNGKSLPDVLLGAGDILYGKILCCCGDSITYGDDMDSEGITNESPITVYQSDSAGNFTETTAGFKKTWNWQIAERNKMTLYNAGVNGSTMQGIENKNGFSLANGRYTKLPDSIDYLLIWFGWNDAAYGTLGLITDTTNESYYGGYNVVLPYLINKYPYAKIGLIVPFGTDANHRNAIRQLGNKWGVAVWDNYQGGTPLYYGKEDSVGVEQSIVTSNRTKFQANGAHPNFKGHRELGAMIEHWMRSL